MSPVNVVLMVVVIIGLAVVLGWAHEKRKATQVWVWVGTILLLLFVRFFAPFVAIGPASWADVYDGVMPDGYARHSVETSITVDENWIVGETKDCKSYPLIPVVAKFVGNEPGYAAASFHCDEGPTHTVTVNLYGRLNQPEHTTAYWSCTRESESFTCRQTGTE